MKFQSGEGYCGPAALVNAFRCLGTNVAEVRLAAASGCTSEGSSQEQLMAAARSFGFVAERFDTPGRKEAWAWLAENLRVGRPCIVLTLNWDHYVTAAGLLGNRVIIVDSTNEKFNASENGVRVLTKREFMKKWLSTKEGLFSGFSVGKK